MLKRLVLRWVFGARPSTPAPVVHRGERELCPGPGLGATAGPVPKLSREDAELLLGIPVRIVR